MNVDELLKLEPEEFHAIVDGEIRGRLDSETRAALRHPRAIEPFYLELVQAKKSVESQLGAKRLDFAQKIENVSPEERSALISEFHRWRAGAIRFKLGVEECLIEIRKMRARVFPDMQSIKWERNEAIASLHNLMNAITQHRESVLKEFKEDEVSDADRQLWKAVAE